MTTHKKTTRQLTFASLRTNLHFQPTCLPLRTTFSRASSPLQDTPSSGFCCGVCLRDIVTTERGREHPLVLPDLVGIGLATLRAPPCLTGLGGIWSQQVRVHCVPGTVSTEQGQCCSSLDILFATVHHTVSYFPTGLLLLIAAISCHPTSR